MAGPTAVGGTGSIDLSRERRALLSDTCCFNLMPKIFDNTAEKKLYLQEVGEDARVVRWRGRRRGKRLL